jgi:hypothetical protein
VRHDFRLNGRDEARGRSGHVLSALRTFWLQLVDPHGGVEAWRSDVGVSFRAFMCTPFREPFFILWFINRHYIFCVTLSLT